MASKFAYSSPQQMRQQLLPFDKVVGIYKISFPNGANYIGQTENLRERIAAHIGNMDLTNKGVNSPAHLIERQYFTQFHTYTIEIFPCSISMLNVYEDFMVWRYGSFSLTKYVRERRNEYNSCGDHPESFSWINTAEWRLFTEGKDYRDVALPFHLRPENRIKKEKDYGF